MMVLLDTGLRYSELTNLKPQEMDTKGGIIKVMGKGKKGWPGLVLKLRKLYGIILLDEEIVAMIT
ncbi:tyrosine-type recombinase/integrase [Chloroflexota bacterium]